MKKKILIIDDDSMLREALMEWFLEDGYEVEGSSSVLEAFERIENNKPDIILTDLVMANLDGFEVLKKKVIPHLYKEVSKSNSVRIWSIGCSTGEEAYSIAILMNEYKRLTN